MVTNQGLDSYFQVLKHRQRESWIKEEIICVKRNEMNRLNQKSFTALVDSRPKDVQNFFEDDEKKGKKSHLQGVHNYDILANPFYAERYLYTPCRYPKRANFVISRYDDKELRKSSLDLVRLVCDLPYLSEARARKMEFTPEYIYAERLTKMLEEEKLQKEGDIV